MGWDSFGLPAENAAKENNTHPKTWTNKNITAMKIRFKMMGLSYDWSRELSTCDSEYYGQEQKIFLQFYKQGLAYQKESLVNWDPVEKTVLANEQVVDGKGWRSGVDVEKKRLKQWFLRITKYNDALLNGLDQLEKWPEKVRLMQKNWIGRSEGAHVYFKIKGPLMYLQRVRTHSLELHFVPFLLCILSAKTLLANSQKLLPSLKSVCVED